MSGSFSARYHQVILTKRRKQSIKVSLDRAIGRTVVQLYSGGAPVADGVSCIQLPRRHFPYGAAYTLTLSSPIPSRLYTLPHWSNPPFLISDIRALWRSGLSARAPECQKLKIVG